MRLLSTAVSALAISLLTPSGARADGCSTIDAMIETHFVFDQRCMEESPFGLCTEGTIDSGPLAGTTRFTVKTLTSHPKSGDVLRYTGVLVITTTSGSTVTIHDRGMLFTMTGRFFEFEHVLRGTGTFTHAKGKLISQGEQTMNPPGFKGTLAGEVCIRGKHSGESEHSGAAERDFDGEDFDE
jgi:hypothetical protein